MMHTHSVKSPSLAGAAQSLTLKGIDPSSARADQTDHYPVSVRRRLRGRRFDSGLTWQQLML